MSTIEAKVASSDGRLELGDELQRTAEPRPESLGQGFVGGAGRAAGRVAAGVVETEPQGEYRQCDQRDHGDRDDRRQHRMPLEEPRPAEPDRARASRRADRPSRRRAPLLAAEHPLADEAEQGRQQRQRRQHGEQHGDGGRDRDPVEERQAERELAEQRDADGQAGEEDRPSRGVDRQRRGFLGRSTGLDGIAVPGDDEQRVVHADAEPDQDAEDGRELRDREGVAEQAGERVADRDREQRGDERQERGEQRAEGQPEHDQRQDDADAGARTAAAALQLFDVLTTEGHLELAVAGGLRGRDHRLDVVDRVLADLGGEGDRRVGDGAVAADLLGAGGRVRADDRPDGRQRGDLGQRSGRARLHGRIAHGARRGGEHDLVGATRCRREVLLQQGDRGGRLGMRQGELRREGRAGGLADARGQDERGQP